MANTHGLPIAFSLSASLRIPKSTFASSSLKRCARQLSSKLTITMGRIFLITLEGQIYSCKHCHAHFALYDDLISKSFHCRHGKAYLFDKVVNVTIGEEEDRMMITGLHTVVDIFCVGCGSIVGWKYEAAHEESQKYKEGKFILERFQVLGPNGSVYSFGELQPAGMDTDADDV
ncbi:hypothetical protein M9H77_22850 [Catharanthus roseus]|uniref:Uncharacterized protein n=1 Tax=Catharanthus roseus TaxID=4058 RepID=A0ACC0AU70_CATRO|nr:hypothetical protein M9H77_22850 [Catharanthus roseus]